MKKLLPILLILALMLGLVACSASDIGEAIDIIDQAANELIDPAEPAEDAEDPADAVIPDDTGDENPEETPEEPVTPVLPVDDSGLVIPDNDPIVRPDDPPIDEDGVYSQKDEVALYIHTYGHLPSNFITKKEAQAKGWSGGALTGELAGMSIGGDHFGNYEGILPKGDYKECDIDTMNAKSRGAKRIVFSEDAIYYTEDHYETFVQLY